MLVKLSKPVSTKLPSVDKCASRAKKTKKNMVTLSQDELIKYQDQIALFIKLLFEKSENYTLLLSIAKVVGINAHFPCRLLYESDIKSSFVSEQTFLLIAYYYENEDVIRLLLESGADPNTRDEEDAPIIWETQYEYDNPEYGLRVAKLLLEHGADPNIQWEDERFYHYVLTKEADMDGEFEYLNKLCAILEKYAEKH